MWTTLLRCPSENAAPACGDQRTVLATEGGPGGINDNNGRSGSGRVAVDGGPSNAGDHNGRSMASATGRSGQVPALWGPLMASEEGLGSGGDQSGRGAEGGRGGIGGEV